jgi:tetratricopeptide (TPR) repeat protein
MKTWGSGSAITIVGCLLASLAFSACATTREARRQRDEEALKKDSDPKQLAVYGEVSAAAGDMTRAEQYLVAALKAGGDEKAIVPRLLAVCIADQRYPGALDYAETYLRRHPSDTDVRFVAASIYAAVGDTARAREGFERVVAERPNLAEAHYGLATVLRQVGSEPVTADRHYREYLRLQPDGAYAEAARDHLLKSVP